MMRCFLPIANIDKIYLRVISIAEHLICCKIYLIYLIHPDFVLHLGQKYFNISKGGFLVEKLVVDLLIRLNKSIII